MDRRPRRQDNHRRRHRRPPPLRATRPPRKNAPTDLDAALRLAAESDVIIAALGENRYLCGEGVDRRDVRLPGEQEKFLERLAATGKPIVLVVFGGRPMALGAIEHHCAAILYAWYPGQAGGHALADLLSGAASPPAASP